jgi:ribonuclease BN (tRNA processing enzyme)
LAGIGFLPARSVGESLVLLDRGEGTQVALRERGWGSRRLKAIFVTHAHADHVLGLPGLLLSPRFSGKGADEPLTVYGPPPSRTCCGACSWLRPN